MKKKAPIIIIITLIILIIAICMSLSQKNKDDININNKESTESLLEDTEKESTQEESSKVEMGDIIYDVDGDVGYAGYDYGLTNQEILANEDGDYITGGTLYYADDGTTYVIWNVGAEKGNIYYPGDTLPDGTLLAFRTSEDWAKYAD